MYFYNTIVVVCLKYYAMKYLKIFILVISLIGIKCNFSKAQTCPPTIPTAPICTNTCVSTTASNNDNVTTGNTRCYMSGTSTFGTYGLNGGTLVVAGGNLTVNDFDIANTTGSTIIVTGGTLNISWRNLNSLGSLRVCGGTVNVSGTTYNNGFNYNVGSGATLNFTSTFNAQNVVITNSGTTNFTATGQINFNNSGSVINNSGIITGTNADLSLNSSGANVINNTGTITLRDLTINTGNFVNMGNSANLNIRNLNANNQTNSFCVAPGACANFTVTGTAQMNNPLTTSSTLRYCGATTGFPSGGGTGSATSNCVTCPAILPVTWVDFIAIKEQNHIKLTWKTTEEINTSHFEIESSSDAINYQVIAKVPINNKISLNEYVYLQNLPNQAVSYYRIKQIDNDKKFTYSKIVVVNLDISLQKLHITIFPNPAQNTINIISKELINETCQIELINLQGKIEQKYKLSKLDIHTVLSLPDLAKGLYFLRITMQNDVKLYKLIINI